MLKTWQSGNSYLRLVSSLYQEPKKHMTLSMQSVLELQLALEAIQIFEKHTMPGEVKLRCLTTIKLTLEDSKEMSS